MDVRTIVVFLGLVCQVGKLPKLPGANADNVQIAS